MAEGRYGAEGMNNFADRVPHPLQVASRITPDTRAGRITFMWARGKRGLWSMRTPWLSLTAHAEGKAFFHLYPWYEAYLEGIESDPESVYFFLAMRDRVPIAIVPLRHASVTRFGFTLDYWESIVQPHLPFADAVLAAGADASGVLDGLVAFLRQMAPRWHLLLFRRAPLHGAFSSLLASAQSPWLVDATHPVHVLGLKRSYEEMQTGFRGNFRKNLRKARKKMERAGRIEVERVRERDAVQDAFTRFMRLEAAGWKGPSGTRTAIACDPALVRFYRSLIAGFGALGRCEVNLLKLNGEDVAAQLCLLVDRTYVILKIGYDERHARLAPGNMLLETVLQQQCEEGRFDTVDLVSDARWHDDWSPGEYRVADYFVFDPSWRGRVLYGLWRAKNLVRPLYRDVLPRARVRVASATSHLRTRVRAACAYAGLRSRRIRLRKP